MDKNSEGRDSHRWEASGRQGAFVLEVAEQLQPAVADHACLVHARLRTPATWFTRRSGNAASTNQVSVHEAEEVVSFRCKMIKSEK